MKSDGIWKDMRDVYQQMGLSEDDINDRIICKTGKVLNNLDLDECD
jgi:hypothetical protein